MSSEHHTIELPSSPIPSSPLSDDPRPNGALPNGALPDDLATSAPPHGLPTIHEPPPMLLDELMLPAERESVPRARRFSRSVTAKSGIAHLRDDAEVLISELVTNAVRHATGSALRVRLLRAGTRLRIEVHDQGTGVPRPRQVDLMEQTGRGWFLVAVMADRHGTEHTPSGKSVWCEVRAWPRDEHPGH
ncbi:ATP-binding protein [Actinomadura chokoriensis]|uniref:ATP-binding protein n=1 Tax=Actinomadura chokoriensis TaxID=454156 RepID=A0ABV4QNN1_9ACTN